MDNYCFVYDKNDKQEYACHQDYYDKHRDELIIVAIGTIDELMEFLGSEFIVINDKE
jgi:hypothetical protein